MTSLDTQGAGLAPEPEALNACARLFARLLLFELDRAGWEELRGPELREALAGLGVPWPERFGRGEADRLAVHFLECFLRPETGGPPVQSLWTEGTYEGRAAVAVRKLAEAAGIDFDRGAARGASHDHLGSILLLWAEVDSAARAGTAAPGPAGAEVCREVAARLERDHLRWALEPLGQVAGRAAGAESEDELARFYPGVARACGRLILTLAPGEGT